MTGEGAGQVAFDPHLEFLRQCLAERRAIVGRLEAVLNAQRKPVAWLQDRAGLTRFIDACFGDDAGLGRQLTEAHRADGFRPRSVDGLCNDLVDPAEMAVRAFHCWQQTRWPGRNGRARYAETLFNLFVLRRLEMLSLRLWDAGADQVRARLAGLQGVLDSLWQSAPDDQPVILRDARWLIPLAQSPTTDDLGAYFEISAKIAASFAGDDLIEIRKASVVMIGGHLRSQIRHYCLAEGVSLDDASVLRRTRTSNALDFALLIQGLVPLLEAYEYALQSGEDERRSDLANVICQAISPDPELFVNRLDLLGPYSMIDYLFVTIAGDGQAEYSPMGQRQVEALIDYARLIERLAASLSEDGTQFRPGAGAYSPYGAIFGTPSNLTEDIALKVLDREASTGFVLEDVFVAGGADKLTWVDGWRDLPHVPAEVRELYAFPRSFAEAIHARIEHALHAATRGAKASVATGRLRVIEITDAEAAAGRAGIADLPPGGVLSSDAGVVAANAAQYLEPTRLLRDRQEGYFLVSYATAGGWVAIRKDFLTDVLGAGHDASLQLPPAAAGVTRLMAMSLAPDAAAQVSTPPSILKA